MNKAVIFDLDGTIYFGNELAFYAKESLEKLKELGYETIFFTNNSTKTRREIYDKLIKLDLDVDLNKVYTSAYATAKYLQEIDIEKVFLIGTESFEKELNSLDIEVVAEDKAQAVVIGLDIEFNYSTISKALTAVMNGAKIIASNADKSFPIENGLRKPGSNAILSALLGSCDKSVDYIVGKPNTYLLEVIVKDWNLNKENIWVVGDAVDSDIAMANNYGCKSVLVTENTNTLKDALYLIQEDSR